MRMRRLGGRAVISIGSKLAINTSTPLEYRVCMLSHVLSGRSQICSALFRRPRPIFSTGRRSMDLWVLSTLHLKQTFIILLNLRRLTVAVGLSRKKCDRRSSVFRPAPACCAWSPEVVRGPWVPMLALRGAPLALEDVRDLGKEFES